MNANSLSGGWFISREFQSYRLLVPSLGLCLPFVLSVESRVALAGLSPVGCAIALVRSNLGSAGHTYPNGKKGCFSLHLHFHCAASVGSHLIFGHKPYCASMFLPHFSHSEAMGSDTKSLLPGLLLGELDNTFSSLVMSFSCGLPPFHLLLSLICCCLSASVCPQRPCSILLFWDSLAVSYFSFN